MAIKEGDVNAGPESTCQKLLAPCFDASTRFVEHPPAELAPELSLSCSGASTSTFKPSSQETLGKALPRQGLKKAEDLCTDKYGPGDRSTTAFHQVAKHPKYALEHARRETMTTWPREAFQDVDALVAAGFFFDGHKDRVTCFSCGGALCNWDQNDDPLMEHVRWYPDCAYVRLCLGPQENAEIAKLQEAVLETNDVDEPSVKEIDDVIAREIDSSCLDFYESFKITRNTFRKAIRLLLKEGVPIEDIKKSHIEEALKEVTKIQKKGLNASKKLASSTTGSTCAVCLDEEKSVLFLPCQHLVACVNCAAAISTCPMCRTPIAKSIRAFFC